MSEEKKTIFEVADLFVAMQVNTILSIRAYRVQLKLLKLTTNYVFPETVKAYIESLQEEIKELKKLYK